MSLGCGMHAAERRRLPAERYSPSPLSVLEEEAGTSHTHTHSDNVALKAHAATHWQMCYLLRVMLRQAEVASGSWRMAAALTVMNISKVRASSTSSSRQGTISARTPGGADTSE